MGFDFLIWVDCPESKELMKGLKSGMMYQHVDTSYLNELINHVDIVDAYMVQHYKCPAGYKRSDKPEETPWEDSCKFIDDGIMPHTDIPSCVKKYDIHILAKREGYYYYFIFNRDHDHSCVGKFEVDRFKSDEEAIKALKERIMEDFDTVHDIIEMVIMEKFDKTYNEDECMKRINPEFLHGWITL